MSDEQQSLAIVFADIVGAAELYDSLGDEGAQKAIEESLGHLSEAVRRNQGEIIKYIGEELMCRFDKPDHAFFAACEMQESANLEANPDLRIKVGMHYGPVIFQSGDLFGDAVNVAARMAGIAMAEQIIATQDFVEELSPERDLFALLQAQTSFLPSELRSWVGTFNRFSWNLVMRKARDELNTLWRREIFDDYNSAVAGRYPISEKAALDLELYEFTSFFAPGGRIDRFVDNHLKGFINTRSSSWQEKPIDGQVLGLEKDTLTQLHDAKQISRVFFTKNTQKPYFTFIVRPVRLDESVTRLSLSLGESRIQYTHGAAGLTRITWPPKTTNESRIEFLPRRGVPVYRSERGLWAMYRLLDSGRFERNERGSAYDVTLERGGFETVLELRVEGGYNPLGERLLQNFRLPEQL
jgi:type VI protein secretion system component VasK